MRSMKAEAPWAFLAVALAGCGDHHTPTACPAYAAAGLGVTVSNASTGQPICDATVTATEGAYSEQLAGVGCRFACAFERPGTYVVRATSQGFAPNEVAAVHVVMGAGDCPHVQEALVEIALEPDGVPAPR